MNATTTYSSRSNAIRGAKSAGLDGDQVEVTKTADDRWTFTSSPTPAKADDAKMQADPPAQPGETLADQIAADPALSNIVDMGKRRAAQAASAPKAKGRTKGTAKAKTPATGAAKAAPGAWETLNLPELSPAPGIIKGSAGDILLQTLAKAKDGLTDKALSEKHDCTHAISAARRTASLAGVKIERRRDGREAVYRLVEGSAIAYREARKAS